MNFRRIILVALLASTTIITSCGSTNEYVDNEKYQSAQLNVYEQKDQQNPDKFPVRFYESTPHIPYVDVQQYFQYFFAHDDYRLIRDNYIYELNNNFGSFIKMDSKYNVLILKYAHSFNNHKESIESTGLTFLSQTNITVSGYADKYIPLYNYGIDIHSDGDKVYMPLSFMSLFAGASWMYNVVYNGKNIYIFDRTGAMSSDGAARNSDYYGDPYYEILSDVDTPRYKDVAEYTYGQICCIFDHFRGYTSQLSFGDNNLLTLGTNGILEEYYPKLKQLLLSLDKKEYYAGYNVLLGGMSDGGHTASLMNVVDSPFAFDCVAKNLDFETYQKEIDIFRYGFYEKLLISQLQRTTFGVEKKNIFPYVPSGTESTPAKINYYYLDANTKTAYVGFDSFVNDSIAWDDFYKNHKDPSEAPVETDSYAFIRSCFYQALEDKAENLVLDLSTNGGGQSNALLGIMGLFNKGKAYMGINNTQNRSRTTEYFDVDINLDGKWDEKDIEEANKFNFNFGVLTSRCSFSCGNLLPSLLKELGIKTIGERSGGGSCSIVTNSTTEGLVFAHSSELCLSNANGDNIDSGIPVNLELPVSYNEVTPYLLDLSKFYDLELIGNYLSTAYRN